MNSGVVAMISEASERGQAERREGEERERDRRERRADDEERAGLTARRGQGRPAREGARARPASATRSSAVQTGPISGETTRKNRNAAPQTAPR